MTTVNETHDPARRSWVTGANEPETDFPIQNLPFGMYRRSGDTQARAGVAIGNEIVDLATALQCDLLTGHAVHAVNAIHDGNLNGLLQADPMSVSALRAQLSELLRLGGTNSSLARGLGARLLVRMADATLQMPVAIGNFTDFSCSFAHMAGMRGGHPAPAFFHLPIAYHGRASSVRVSGTPVLRPQGQWAARAPDQDIQFGPEPHMDFELELGAFVSHGNLLGERIPIEEASGRLFGYCLVNDWSARGIQFFESLLGPFLGKSFLTTVSPWILTREALAPFRCALPMRTREVPKLPRHLFTPVDQESGGLDIELTASLQTAAMREQHLAPSRIVRTQYRDLYWSMAQMLTHHASNGCDLQTGDLLASGTTSGPAADAKACLVELNQRGTQPLLLPSGEQRLWLENGDELQIRGRAQRDGYISIGFGACDGRIVPATS